MRFFANMWSHRVNCKYTMLPEILEERIRLTAGEQVVDGLIAYPSTGRPRFSALIAGAHPLLGGGAGNNIVKMLREGLSSTGATFAMDYPMPSSAEGSERWERMVSEFWRTSHVPEERHWLDGGRLAFEQLQRIIDAPIVLIGYSFGCWVASELAASTGVHAVICISPNPGEHELSGLNSRKAPLLIVASDNDFSCPAPTLRDWYQPIAKPKRLDVLSGAEHFFRGRESEVLGAVRSFLVGLHLWTVP